MTLVDDEGEGGAGPDGQGAVGPVAPPLQEGLVLLVKVQGAQQGHVVLEPGGLEKIV